MRLIAFATFSALMLTPAAAQTIKATGANAAGVCAGALDMVGQYLDKADDRNNARILQVQRGRDFFAELPQFPNSDIAAAANAFITFMSGRLANAQTLDQQQAIQRELVKLATGCLKSAQRPTQAAPAIPPGGAVAPPITVLPAQPLTTQPLVTEPLQTQPLITAPLPTQPYTLEPLETQPLILDPQ